MVSRLRGMKDSGVEWIGQIPKDWKLARLGSLLSERNEKVSDIDYAPLSVTKYGIVPQLESAAKSDNHSDRKKVCVGDFVINSRSDRKQSCGLSELEGSVSVISIVLKNRHIEPSYLKYLLDNYGFAEEFYRWGTGIVADLWSTRYERMKRLTLPIPSLERQKQIGCLIECKTSLLDSLIEKTKSTIADYKLLKQSIITEAVTKGLDKNVELKDSGIEWIGEIPKGWKIVKFNRIASVKSNLVNPDDYLEFIQISPDRIEKNTGQLLDCVTVKDSGVISPNHHFKKGQILYSKIRPELNKVTIAPHDGLCSADMYPIETSLNVKYLMYFMLSQAFMTQVTMNNNRVKMPKINQDELSEIKILYSSLEEQDAIVQYLDGTLDRLSKIIVQKERLIEELNQYKKSLIYEYVTGKKEVL